MRKYALYDSFVEIIGNNGTILRGIVPTASFYIWTRHWQNANLARSFIPNYFLYVTIVVGTVVLIALYKRSLQIRKSLKVDEGTQRTKKISVKESKLFKSVIAVCVIYIVTNMPQNVFETVYSQGYFYIILVSESTTLFRSFNHAVNIFVYLAINTRYREQFRIMFCPCLKEKGKTLR